MITINSAPASHEVSDIDVSRWIVKIGNQEQQNEYVEKGFWSKVKKYASKVPFARNAVSMYYCAGCFSSNNKKKCLLQLIQRATATESVAVGLFCAC